MGGFNGRVLCLETQLRSQTNYYNKSSYNIVKVFCKNILSHPPAIITTLFCNPLLRTNPCYIIRLYYRTILKFVLQ